MFAGQGVTTVHNIHLPTLNQNISQCFYNSSNLTSITNFYVNSATMPGMVNNFCFNCVNLHTVENLSMPNAKNTRYMFYNCRNIRNFSMLTGMPNLTDATCMFLNSINSFTTDSINNLVAFLNNCPNIANKRFCNVIQPASYYVNLNIQNAPDYQAMYNKGWRL
jgi:hypothetical protein